MRIEEKDNMNLQTAFDLLGEILKFNKRTILIFESSLSSAELERICEKLTSNIIDSNVFIRSLLISLYRFNSVISHAKRSATGSTAKPTKWNSFLSPNSPSCSRS